MDRAKGSIYEKPLGRARKDVRLTHDARVRPVVLRRLPLTPVAPLPPPLSPDQPEHVCLPLLGDCPV